MNKTERDEWQNKDLSDHATDKYPRLVSQQAKVANSQTERDTKHDEHQRCRHSSLTYRVQNDSQTVECCYFQTAQYSNGL